MFGINKAMVFDYVGTKVFYKINRKKDKPFLVFLHGWQGSLTNFQNLTRLKSRYSTLQIDFPPFGKSKEPKDWNVFSYANMVISLCEHLKIKNAYFLGHSFGGRICILVGIIKPELASRLILVDSAGVKPKRKIGYYLKKTKFTMLKLLGCDTSMIGSKDYIVLNSNMKKTFSSIVSTTLEEYACKLEQKTLIVFGERDRETPIYMAKKLQKCIKNSTLYIMKNCGHFCFLEKPFEFCEVVLDFLEGEE